MAQKSSRDDEKLEGGGTIESHPDSPDRVPPTPTAEGAKSLALRLKQAKELEQKQRLTALNLELKPLLDRFHFVLSAEPFIENGQIKAKPILVDTFKEEAV